MHKFYSVSWVKSITIRITLENNDATYVDGMVCQGLLSESPKDAGFDVHVTGIVLQNVTQF